MCDFWKPGVRCSDWDGVPLESEPVRFDLMFRRPSRLPLRLVRPGLCMTKGAMNRLLNRLNARKSGHGEFVERLLPPGQGRAGASLKSNPLQELTCMTFTERANRARSRKMRGNQNAAKPDDVRRSEVVIVRLTVEEKARLQTKAWSKRQSMTQFILEACGL